MNDLLKKLNVLVKSSINDVLGEDWALGAPRRRNLTPEKLGPEIDREIGTLRQRINEALAYEDELRGRVQGLETEVARLDQQADVAVAANHEAAARYAIEQMQRAQQRQKMAEADLHDHQLVTQELIQRVNMLEAAVADTRRAQAEAKTAEAPPPAQAEPAQREPSLSEVLREAREKITQMGDMISAKTEIATPTAPAEPTNEAEVEDDLDQRRQRLSKK